jgi:hypothetical protein
LPKEGALGLAGKTVQRVAVVLDGQVGQDNHRLAEIRQIVENRQGRLDFVTDAANVNHHQWRLLVDQGS